VRGMVARGRPQSRLEFIRPAPALHTEESNIRGSARELDLEPEKVLTKASLAEPHRIYMTPEDHEQAWTES